MITVVIYRPLWAPATDVSNRGNPIHAGMVWGLPNGTNLQLHSAIVELPAKPSECSATAETEPRCVLPRQVCWKDTTFEEGWGLTWWKKGFAHYLPQHGWVRGRAGEMGFGWLSGGTPQKGAGLNLASLGQGGPVSHPQLCKGMKGIVLGQLNAGTLSSG